jgi:hypothetical protein
VNWKFKRTSLAGRTVTPRRSSGQSKARCCRCRCGIMHKPQGRHPGLAGGHCRCRGRTTQRESLRRLPQFLRRVSRQCPIGQFLAKKKGREMSPNPLICRRRCVLNIARRRKSFSDPPQPSRTKRVQFPSTARLSFLVAGRSRKQPDSRSTGQAEGRRVPASGERFRPCGDGWSGKHRWPAAC